MDRLALHFPSLGIGIGHHPIVTGPYPIWLTATQLGALCVVLLLTATLTVYNLVAAWKRWRGGHVSLGEDGVGIKLPPRSMKEAQDREIWDNVRNMMPEQDEPTELERFWRKAMLQSAGLFLITLPAFWLIGGSIEYLLDSTVGWTAKLPIIAYICSSIIQYFFIAMIDCISQFALHLGPRLVAHHAPAGTWLSAFPLLLTFAQFIYSGCMPHGPIYRIDKRYLYNRGVRAALDKGAASIEEFANAEEAEDAGRAPENEYFGVNSVSCDESLGMFSWMATGWVPPVISAAARMSQVDIQHLPAVPRVLRSQEIAQELHDNGHTDLSTAAIASASGFFWLLCKAQMRLIVPWLGICAINVPLDYLPHVSLQLLLHSIEGGLRTDTAFAWACMLVGSKAANRAVRLIEYHFDSTMIGPRMRNHSMLLVYRKLLTRNTYSTTGDAAESKDKSAATADVNPLNIITTDVASLVNIIDTAKSITMGQLELLLAGFYIWSLLGISGLIGLSTLVLVAVPSYFLTRRDFRIRTKLLATRDERMSLMQEAIQAISMIKMMAAEAFWHRRIMNVRETEFGTLFKLKCLSLLSGLLQSIGPDLILAVSFGHYTLVRKQKLTASIAFTSINVFSELRPVLDQMPTYITELLDQLLAARRVAAFLRLPDIEPLEMPAKQRDTTPREFSIQGSITWKRAVPTGPPTADETASTELFKLVDLDISFPKGKTTLVAGKFGSGKSLLLQGLLGEAHLIEGKVTYAVSTMLPPNLGDSCPVDWSWDIILDTVAYAPQTAWLLSASIRENILFGLPMDVQRYKQVVYAVGLLPDLAILDDADLTEIGERGKILSGGQKARVSLARAMYSRAATVILDDVISAVDATTSQHIIQHCFGSDLMRDRTLIIASHAVEALAPLAHQAVFLDNGRIPFTGTGPELLQSEHMRHLAADTEVNGRSAEVEGNAAVGKGGLVNHEFEVKEAQQKTPRQLVIEDARSDGSVKVEHWWNLIKANGGYLQWTVTTISVLFTCLGPLVCMRILALWTEDVSHPTESSHSVQFWLIIYCCASLGSGFIYELGYFWMWRGSFRALRSTHKDLLTAMLGATMPYFSKTRAGSILQRFGRDLADITSASYLIFHMSTRIVTICVTTVTVTIYGGWPFALATLIMLALMYRPSLWYRSASRQMRRLEMVIPGLVNSIYSETIAGSAVVRAFGAQSLMVNDLLQTLNMRQCANTWRMYTSRWLYAMFRIFDTGMLTAVLAVILINSDISASTTGFLISFVEGLSISLNWALLDLRNIELDGISLERLADFRAIKQEERNSDVIIEESWPSQGIIRATNLCARYEHDLPDILHNISFDVQGGTKVGIVGASGGGKSTLAKTLFSFVQVSGGNIEIDGVDISTINLSKLRSSLGIISQDPILLSGSLRLNLDIESQYSDADLYEALRQVQLIKVAGSKAVTPAVSRAPSVRISENGEDDGVSASDTAVGSEVAAEDATIFNDLDFQIKTGGENLSAGQKQLVVLARAILRQHKILIMDEATASIDSETDQAISRIVHDGFKGATVLIIAHRLRTIMPCAKILVVDKGELVQQGSPLELIRQQGKFRELCEAAGKEEYTHLCSIAEAESKRNDGYLVDV